MNWTFRKPATILGRSGWQVKRSARLQVDSMARYMWEEIRKEILDLCLILDQEFGLVMRQRQRSRSLVILSGRVMVLV